MEKINKENLSHKSFFLLKTLATGSLVIYAYIYLIGYSYLYSYFKNWGLSVIDIGFNINDYVVTAIYPLIYVFSYSVFPVILIIILSSSISSYIYKKSYMKRNKLNFQIAFLLISGVGFVLGVFISMVILCASTHFFEYSIFFIIPLIYFYLSGLFLFVYLKRKNKKTKTYFLIIVLLGLILFPFYGSIVGSNFASTERQHSFNLLKSPNYLHKVIIYSNEPIEGLSLFETKKNRYENLLLITEVVWLSRPNLILF